MAKKKEVERKYLQVPLPQGQGYGKMTKRAWQGFNKRNVIDTGALSVESNISTKEAPYLTPSEKPKQFYYTDPATEDTPISNPLREGAAISIHGFGDVLIWFYQRQTAPRRTVIHYECYRTPYLSMCIEQDLPESNVSGSRCLVQFNVYNNPLNPVESDYTKKILIFPDLLSMDLDPDVILQRTGDNRLGIAKLYDDTEIVDFYNGVSPYTPPSGGTYVDYKYYRNTYNGLIYKLVGTSSWETVVPASFPPIEWATVHLSRLFGVAKGIIYASGFNDYSNWNLDTADEYNESNAWISATQSNVQAEGNFTGITTFLNHVLCFKKNFMHEIYNTKNPFRVHDIYAEGAVDNRTIREVNGQLIFVSEDGVKIYTGSKPREISYNLNLDKFYSPVSGSDDRYYYLVCGGSASSRKFYVYDTLTQCWAERTIPGNTNRKIEGIARNNQGLFCITSGIVSPESAAHFEIYKLDTGDYDHDWHFETDITTNASVDIKHIKKIQFLADIAAGANIKVHFLYGDEDFDGMTAAEKSARLVYDYTNSANAEIQKTIRVKPRMTANYGFRARISGHGFVRIYTMEMLVENGGDLYASN